MASIAIDREDTGRRARTPAHEPEPVRLALDDRRWGAFVDSCPSATPFHHPAWAGALAEAYRFPAFALVTMDADGRPLAGAPFLEIRSPTRRRRWASLPFTDQCQPLARDATAERAYVVALARANKRLGAPCIEVRAAVGAEGWRTDADAVLQVLELDESLDSVRRRFSRSQVIRNIARAEREGVTVRRADSAGDLDCFYALHTRTRRRQGVPVQPRRFFDVLWARLVEPGLGSILLAAGDGAPIAGALFLSWNGTTVYKFGASDPAGWSLRPNHMLFWTAIQESFARGDRRFDFGRTDLANAGLRSFKGGWGATERPLVHSTLPTTHREGRIRRALGAVIRVSPPWVCRGLGEALYRYAGSR